VVSRLLEERGVEVAVTTRQPERPDSWDGRVRKLQAFAGDVVSLGKAFTGADTVVQAIQFPNHPVEDPDKGRTYMEADARGTEVAGGRRQEARRAAGSSISRARARAGTCPSRG
jgi:NADH dehydrogenase